MQIEHTAEGRRARLSRDQLHAFKLRTVAAALWCEPESGESGRAGTTLVKTPELRVVVEVLEEGERLTRHVAPGPITLQVLDGEIRFEVGDEVVYAKSGELLVLPSITPHSVEAVRDSSLLLTIAPERSKERTGS